MEKLISRRSDLQVVPESFILPLETRPGNTQVFVLEDIPVIDFQQLGIDRQRLIKQIINAAQEFEFFQLINHGVSTHLLHNVLDVANHEFFELPFKDKASFYCEETKKSCRLYTSNDDIYEWEGTLRTGEKN
ncbi:protein DOWNY MILDEW RESISTANCE 6-like [Rosa rugosa]|uniref:protein DOWNY MILDEW RESISTANCE 6-like n=1 Tax=Rosa rugosa TaxID=74645 RepID=UPI002B413917|nr:protein DOWNY MILDEW RESISTANCE 6-like [Rosa rugosa]